MAWFGKGKHAPSRGGPGSKPGAIDFSQGAAMRRRRRKYYDEHHLFPKSRFPQHRSATWNRRPMRRSRHTAWHQLVDNKSPLEALLDLFYEFTPHDIDKLRDDPALDAFRALLDRLPSK